MPVPDRLPSARRRTVALILGLALAAAATVVPLAAQVADATLEILVVDQTQQALPGVTVTPTRRPDTGSLERTTIRDAAAVGRVAALPPGTYRCAELDGFSPPAGAACPARRPDGPAPGHADAAVAESITVSTTVPLVDVYKTDTLDQHRARADRVAAGARPRLPAPGLHRAGRAARARRLPLHRRRPGRSAPAATPASRRSWSTAWTSPIRPSACSKIRFSQDAISEFRVMNNRYDTEVGGTAGGALSIVTRAARTGRRHRRSASTAPTPARAGRAGAGGQRLLPRPVRLHPRRPASPRTRPTTSSPSSRSTRTTSPSSGPAAPIRLDRPRDVEHPFDQTLGFAKLDHSLSEAHTLAAELRLRAIPGGELPRRRRRLRVRGPAAATGTTGTSPWRTSASSAPGGSTSCASRRAAQVRRAAQLERRGRVVLLGQHAADRRATSWAICSARERVELRDTFHWHRAGRGRTISSSARRSSITRSARGSTRSRPGSSST